MDEAIIKQIEVIAGAAQKLALAAHEANKVHKIGMNAAREQYNDVSSRVATQQKKLHDIAILIKSNISE